MLMNNFRNQEQQTERKCRWIPATNISETDVEYRIEIAVPGFNKEDFRIELEKDVLSISTAKEEAHKEAAAETSFRMREFGRNSFCRSFSLPESVDKDSIKAEYLNGILMISLPKKEEVRIKKEVQVR
jgi:HSP20 family protein